MRSDPLRVWSPAEVLERTPAAWVMRGTRTSTPAPYLLLGLMIEHVRGRPAVEVLRDGALAVGGIERLVSQPDEQPTEPVATPRGADLETIGVISRRSPQ